MQNLSAISDTESSNSDDEVADKLLTDDEADADAFSDERESRLMVSTSLKGKVCVHACT